MRTVLVDWLKTRLWPAVAELGMAFSGLVVGWLVAGTLLGLLGPGPWTLAAGPLITALAALFYATVGLRWAVAAETPQGEPSTVPPAVCFERAGLLPTVIICAAGIVVALMGSLAIGLVFEAVQLEVREQGAVLDIAARAREQGIGLEAITLAVSALLLAPVAEEWLFRGLLFARIAGRAGLPIAYVVSGLGFAAIHDNPAGFAIYLWLGLVFAAVLARTGRLGAAVAVHMGNNLYVLAMLFFGVEG